MSHRDSRRYYPQERSYNQRWNSSQAPEYISRRAYDNEPKDSIPSYEPRPQKRTREVVDYRVSSSSVGPSSQLRSHDDRRPQSQSRYNDERSEARYVYERSFEEEKRPPSRFDRYENRYDNRFENQQNPPIFQSFGSREQQIREEKETYDLTNDINDVIFFVNQQRKADPPIGLFTAPNHCFDSWD